MARTGERENLMKMIYQMGVQEDFSAEEYEKVYGAAGGFSDYGIFCKRLSGGGVKPEGNR